MNVTCEGDISSKIDEAVVHVIKTKMVNSDRPNQSIILNTGGRVSDFLLIETTFKHRNKMFLCGQELIWANI